VLLGVGLETEGPHLRPFLVMERTGIEPVTSGLQGGGIHLWARRDATRSQELALRHYGAAHVGTEEVDQCVDHFVASAGYARRGSRPQRKSRMRSATDRDACTVAIGMFARFADATRL
jgi:hypothetical protein